jgi:hypothetical protein
MRKRIIPEKIIYIFNEEKRIIEKMSMIDFFLKNINKINDMPTMRIIEIDKPENLMTPYVYRLESLDYKKLTYRHSYYFYSLREAQFRFIEIIFKNLDENDKMNLQYHNSNINKVYKYIKNNNLLFQEQI